MGASELARVTGRLSHARKTKLSVAVRGSSRDELDERGSGDEALTSIQVSDRIDGEGLLAI